MADYSRAVAVTPHDSTNLETPAQALWIGVAGTLTFIPDNESLPRGTDATAVATTVPAGLFPVRVKRVNAAGTAATGIVALY